MGRDALLATFLHDAENTPGDLDVTIRSAAIAYQPVPEDLAPLVDKIRKQAFKVVDEDIQRLLDAGYSQDALYELIVATAVGAGKMQLDTALSMIDEASR